MTEAQLNTALTFLADVVLPAHYAETLGGFLSVQFLGGEVLTIPSETFQRMVLTTRRRLSPLFGSYQDGVQSNLLGSRQRVFKLHALFGKRIGTSVDGHTGQRQLGGDSARYEALLQSRVADLSQRRNVLPGAVFVLDAPGLPHLPDVIQRARRAGQALTLRPVFSGGSQDIAPATLPDLAAALADQYKQWIDDPVAPVEPFLHLTRARLGLATAGCPFQRDCAAHSLDLDPNGDLFVCQEMADGQRYRLGNALEGWFDGEAQKQLRQRGSRLDPVCQACPWQAACQGGCMNETLQAGRPLHSRSPLCPVWQSIFGSIDRAVADLGADEVRRRVNKGF